MTRVRPWPLFAGALAAAVLGAATGLATGGPFVAALRSGAESAIAAAGGNGVRAEFAAFLDLPSRHPVLTGGARLDEATRLRTARAVAAVPGVGGVHWAAGGLAAAAGPRFDPLHCEQDVDGLLRNRSLRFAEGSAALLPLSLPLLGEVADALRPCAGAIIAIDGHTDRTGIEADNVRLSLQRAQAVREALIARGLDPAALRARGLGSAQPAEGLAPGDPANRRIDFALVRNEPLAPTPIDTPGAY